jgi:hypothetical protein
MERDEVLERLDAAGADRGPIQYELVHVSLLRAAAEIIRESGKVAEALGEIVSCEPIDHDPVHKRIKYVEVQIHRTDIDRYRKIVADYFEPAPTERG